MLFRSGRCRFRKHRPRHGGSGIHRTPQRVTHDFNSLRFRSGYFSGNFILRFRKACGLFGTSFSPEGSKPKTASVPDSAKIRCNLPKIMLYCLLLCFLCGILSEQLRILGSPACLEPCRAKPTGAGGPRAVKIKPLELYDEKSEPFRP